MRESELNQFTRCRFIGGERMAILPGIITYLDEPLTLLRLVRPDCPGCGANDYTPNGVCTYCRRANG